MNEEEFPSIVWTIRIVFLYIRIEKSSGINREVFFHQFALMKTGKLKGLASILNGLPLIEYLFIYFQ